jgi:RNA polymerase sigma-70 factor, ECF subfamily
MGDHGAMTSPLSSETLGELLVRTGESEQAAFVALYDATAPRVHGMVLRVLRDRAQSEEVVQEVYLQVWREAPAYDPTRGSALSWLLTLAHRRAVDRVRSETAQSRREVVYEARHATRPHDSTSDLVERRWEAEMVHEALDRLGDRQREALELAYFEGLTHREVSERLNLPLGTAKTRIRDGLRTLRRQMGGAP